VSRRLGPRLLEGKRGTTGRLRTAQDRSRLLKSPTSHPRDWGTAFPSDDDNVGEYRRDADSALEQITYLLPLLADVFRGRLGLEPSGDAERRLGLLGAIQLLNHYHFQDIGLPPKGDLELDADRAADAVVKAEKHVGSLLAKLKEFRTYLREHNLGVFHAAATDIERYIEILEAHPAPAGGVAA